MTDNPYQAPVAVETPLPWRGALEFVGRTCFQIAAVIQIVVIIVAIASAVFDIHSIVKVGIVLILAGAMTATFAVIFRNLLGVVFGVSGPAVCIMCYFAIDLVTRGKPLLQWGSIHARELLLPIVIAYGCVAMPVGVLVLIRSWHILKLTLNTRDISSG